MVAPGLGRWAPHIGGMWGGVGRDGPSAARTTTSQAAATTAALTLKARYEIEAGFDYLYVQASTDGGTTWTSLDGTARGEPFVCTASDQPAISGSSDGEWVDVNVPLDAYAGQGVSSS